MIKIITKVEPNNSEAVPIEFEQLLEDYLRTGWRLINTGHQLLPNPARPAPPAPEKFYNLFLGLLDPASEFNFLRWRII